MAPKHLLLATLVLLCASWNSVGFHQGDEHFQILEFAAYKAGFVGGETLPWEFREQMRPALQPGMTYVAYRFFDLFGEVHPYWFAFFLRLLSAGFFAWVAVILYRRYSSALPRELWRGFALLLLFHWCTTYSGIRFSNENWSGLTLALGFLVYPLPAVADKRNIFVPFLAGSARWCFGAGLLFGLSFLLRYQTAVAVVGFGAWLIFVGREHRSRLALVILGGLLALIVGTVVDYWFYGEWVIAPWNYLRINVFEGVAATYGTRPWWGYLELIFERGVPPLSLLYLVAPFWFAYRYRRDPLTWIFVAFFVVHSALSRKDLRFLFPLLPFLPVVLLAGARELRVRYGDDFFRWKWVRRGGIFLIVLNLLLLASVAVRPMTTEVLVNRYIYNHYPEPVTLFADGKHAFSYAELTIRFYQRPEKVTIIRGERAEWPPCNTPVCLYSKQTREPNPPPNARRVYTNKPEWLNFGGWLDGQRWWYIYELE